MNARLAGSGALLKTLLRHDGVKFLPWVAIATLLAVSTALAYPSLFPDAASRAALATAVNANPALGILFGPAYDFSTVDGFTAWRSMSIGGFLTALGAIFAVTRSTRAQEDTGQAELLASGVLGRSSRLFSGVGLAIIGSLAVGLVSGVLTALSGGSWNSSLLLGATFTASGWMFTGVAAIAAQLGSDARTANTLAVSTLGALFLLRGFTYAMDAPNWLNWVNPFGWITEARPGTGDHWLPMAWPLVLTVGTLAVAFALQGRRDFGEGAVAPRPGPADGSIRTVWGLALRLNRGALISWTIAFVAFGVVFGSFATAIHDLLAKDSAVAAILAAGATTPAELTSAFIVTILSMIGLFTAVPGVQLMLRLHSEEGADRLGVVLAGSVSRRRVFAASAALALIASAVYTVIAGSAVAAFAASTDIGVDLLPTLLQVAVTIPAVWATVSVSMLIVGVLPRLPYAAWAGVLIAFVLTLLGPLFQLPEWVISISPFKQVPNLSDANPDWFGLVWVALAAAVFTVVGVAGFRRRDISG